MKVFKTVSHARHFGYSNLTKGFSNSFKTVDYLSKGFIDTGYNKSFGLWYWTIFW